MEVVSDFKELLSLFNELRVDFVIVGGYALAFHGAPRFTGDLDVLVRPEPENARRIAEALERFGFKSAGLTAEDFLHPDRVIQLGVAPVRVDIMTSLTGVTSEEAFSGKV
ncbi:MAG: nucleotidyl transferase AbiEii/AbiGii toxin family protein [Candidatus Eisenbacteria bacterium]|nr:nucleotidyl transferase AbiEii/AbiGii toxin family protein [Candidatus Eisenbacteria bacterium]